MKSFLVATDFSATSREAALYAANLAKLFGAEITLLHAYLLPTPVSEVPYMMISVEELQKDNEKLAAELASSLSLQTGVTVNTLVNIGMPADEIVYQSREIGADLIFLGMRGENTGIDKFIGSTTAAVIRKSHIPVLVIPAGNTFSAISNITYATDYSYTMNSRCLKTMSTLMKKNPAARLHVVNIQRPGEIMTAEQVSGKVWLEPTLEELSHEYHTIENSSVEAGLETFLTKTTSQMLVMVAHKHSWWERLFSGSHTREMVYKAHIPLLVLQDKD